MRDRAFKHNGQLQKIVHDIKKNDGGLMQRIKRFQNDQVATICKTGKDTGDRFTNKTPPNVPQRDYVPGELAIMGEIKNGSDDYVDPDPQSESETYDFPQEENDDDNYEPPPTEHENTLPPSFHFPSANGGYADKPGTRQLPALPTAAVTKPARPLPKPTQPGPKTIQPLPNTPPAALSKPTPNKPLNKPQLTPRPPVKVLPHSGMKKVLPRAPFEDEDDYIVPKDEEEDEDDNYIEPTQDIPQPYKPPAVNRMTKPTHATQPMSSSHLTAQSHEPAKTFSSFKMEQPSDEDDATGEDHSEYTGQLDSLYSPAINDVLMLNSFIWHQLHFGKTRTDGTSEVPESWVRVSSSTTCSSKIYLQTFPNLPDLDLLFLINKTFVLLKFSVPKPAKQRPVAPSRNNVFSALEQEAGVVSKEWYASSCDRKTAEEALYASCKDGSYLVRKSSGQDSKQPYTLVVFYNRKVYNIPVRYIESTRQYALGKEKSGEERFGSIDEMIDNHQCTPLVLIDSQNNTKDSTKLRFAVKVL
ncbi:LOW QUALITY PROTEIN: B-cell linker protein [Pelodytes ibericus]